MTISLRFFVLLSTINSFDPVKHIFFCSRLNFILVFISYFLAMSFLSHLFTYIAISHLQNSYGTLLLTISLSQLQSCKEQLEGSSWRHCVRFFLLRHQIRQAHPCPPNWRHCGRIDRKLVRGVPQALFSWSIQVNQGKYVLEKCLNVRNIWNMFAA